jgi:hypothetical protein
MVSLLNKNILHFHTYIYIFIHRSIIRISQMNVEFFMKRAKLHMQSSKINKLKLHDISKNMTNHKEEIAHTQQFKVPYASQHNQIKLNKNVQMSASL